MIFNRQVNDYVVPVVRLLRDHVSLSLFSCRQFCDIRIRKCSVPAAELQSTRATRKQTLRSLSLSYQKKDGRAWPRPSFIWYDTDFSEFNSADIIDYILEKSVSCRARGRAHPSFGMTTTKTLRSVSS